MDAFLLVFCTDWFLQAPNEHQNHNTYNHFLYEIAMVTFTNEAADNMKVRLKRYFMNCYILTKNKKILHEIEAVDLMQISTIHKFAKAVLQSTAMEYGLGAEFAISSSEYAKEQVYEKYLNDFLVRRQKEEANFAQQLRMPVHKFRKLLMHFSQQLYNKSYGIKELKAENLGTFEEWPFFNEVIMEVIIPAEKEYEEQISSKNKVDLKESMLLLNDAVNGAFREKCGLRYKYLFIDEFQDTDDVQIDSFLKLQNVIKNVKLFVVGDLKQSIYRFRGATISAFDLIRTDESQWEEFSLTINYRTDKRLLDKFDGIFSKMGSRGYLPFLQGRDSLNSSIDTFLPAHDLITKLEYEGDEQRMDALFAEIERQKDIIKYLSTHHKLTSKDMMIAILVRDFIINRDFKYALYDGTKKIAEISLPAKCKKYIATIANYLILETETNARLSNCPVYEKINMLEQEILNRGIEDIIPSKRSQLHYYQIKKYLYDESKYPKLRLDNAKTQKEREQVLKNYYSNDFEDEFLNLARTMDDEGTVYEFETYKKLVNLGFRYEKGEFACGLGSLEYEMDTVFGDIEANINPKEKNITLSIEVFNPYYGTGREEEYSIILERVKNMFADKFKKCPEMHSSNEYGGSEDESVSFSYDIKMNENNVNKFIDTVKLVSDKIL